MAQFSGVLRLTDLDDFVAPSLECIKPVPVPKTSTNSVSVVANERGLVTQIGKDGSERALDKAQITLADCLACSGCVTSAETVLIASQSREEFMRRLRQITGEPAELAESKPVEGAVVVSLSPQSCASIAVRYGMEVDEATLRLAGFFHSLGVARVLDTSVSRELSLLESCTEFVTRWKASGRPPNANAATTLSPSTSAASAPPLLPLIASACPGWVCFAEKTDRKNTRSILPLISSTRSPQQIMGAVVKQVVAQQLAVQPAHVFHATIMPCYDKKLEASRPDFQSSSDDSRDGDAVVHDVDCVLTTGEVESLLLEHGVAHLRDCPLPPPSACGVFPPSPSSDDPDATAAVASLGSVRHSGGGSGGYAETVFRYAARVLFGRTDLPSVLEYRVQRNKDLRLLELEHNGATVLRFAVAHGLRNIQNLVRKLNRGACPYDYIEFMACPSGCLNGGGQLPPTTTATANSGGITAENEPNMSLPAVSSISAQRALVERLEVAYESTRHVGEPGAHSDVQRLYRDWVGAPPDADAALKPMLHTQYHVVPDFESALTMKW